MRTRFNLRGTMIGVAAAVAVAVLLVTVQSVAGQANYRAPRTAAGNPDLNGIWQTLGSAYFNLEGHSASESPVLATGALGAIPAGLGVVVGGEIPYRQDALAQRQENAENWLTLDPAIKCYMPGIPRAMYMPFPLQLVQTPEYILFAHEFASASRIVYMNRPDFEGPAPAWMGHSRGRWEGETLVIDVSDQMPDTWFDRAGNFHSENLRVTERFRAMSPNHLMYEATIEDPDVFTRPWTVRVPLYRRLEENVQLLEFKCVEFVEELMYGHLRRGAQP